MLVAGIRHIGGAVEMIEVPGPRRLPEDEVLIEVRAAGVGNWDEFVRTGGWNVGRSPPMALGVEAAGVVAAVGGMVTDWVPAKGIAGPRPVSAIAHSGMRSSCGWRSHAEPAAEFGGSRSRIWSGCPGDEPAVRITRSASAVSRRLRSVLRSGTRCQ
jgi:threonine dehydrogenase-like Zn-dependent dehydrogenase